MYPSLMSKRQPHRWTVDITRATMRKSSRIMTIIESERTSTYGASPKVADVGSLSRVPEKRPSLSSSESYGMAAAEAVAAGLPMFGLATGELHSFGRNDARWLLPVDATDNAIAAALHGLMSRPDALRDSRGVAVTAPRSWAEVAAEFVAACR